MKKMWRKNECWHKDWVPELNHVDEVMSGMCAVPIKFLFG